ncbi:MAG TPA: PTS sugar transporter subunit IIB [Candidatus Olsenella stercoravium]|uniref:PTS system mannose-specific EIIAB component n=1 Tax=Candidatus Olsenella stercoravium TaxID=2838713 RepID=A0A9D2DLM1_9ACTN|nr:PTS sugar transporter subunit IIB [Candidatus Olsenella stercoravium]
MVSIVLASHGTFAEGIKMSGQMIFGPQENVAAVTLMPEMGPDDLRAKLLEAVAGFEDQDQVLFLVDLQGGTPWNQVTLLLGEEGHENWVAVGGLNLPMLVSAYGERMGSDSAAEVAKAIYSEAKAGVCIKPEDLAPADDAPAPAAAPAAAPVGAIPPGTVLGDGHIKIAHCRVDTRLLHGQVATAWTKQINPDRIIVVSDGVAHDELRKTMIVQAAPPGVKAHVIPIKKMIEVAKDPRFGATKAFLLFETPQDVLKAIEGGVDIKNVNIGSMAHSVGKVVVTNAIAMDEADVECLEALQAKGVTFDIRKVPADSPENFEAMMSKAKSELAAQAAQA